MYKLTCMICKSLLKMLYINKFIIIVIVIMIIIIWKFVRIYSYCELLLMFPPRVLLGVRLRCWSWGLGLLRRNGSSNIHLFILWGSGCIIVSVCKIERVHVSYSWRKRARAGGVEWFAGWSRFHYARLRHFV